VSPIETLKKKLFELLDECNEHLSKYKELRSNGLSKDEVFEAIHNTRKQVLSEILDLI
jgi:hypothetical protein